MKDPRTGGGEIRRGGSGPLQPPILGGDLVRRTPFGGMAGPPPPRRLNAAASTTGLTLQTSTTEETPPPGAEALFSQTLLAVDAYPAPVQNSWSTSESGRLGR